MRRFLVIAFQLTGIILVITAAFLAVPPQLDTRQRVALFFLGALTGIAALDQLLGLKLKSRWIDISQSIGASFIRGWKDPGQRRLILACLTVFLLLVLGGVFLLLVLGGVSYYFYQQAQSPDKVVVLIAQFNQEGPGTDSYGANRELRECLDTETSQFRYTEGYDYGDPIDIDYLPESIGTREKAESLAGEHQADIVVWGWYVVTETIVRFQSHFLANAIFKYPHENPRDFELGEKRDRGELEWYTMQERLGCEIASFTMGLAYYLLEDWEKAISQFDNALILVVGSSGNCNDLDALVESLVERPDEGMISFLSGLLFLRGNAHLFYADYKDRDQDDPLENLENAIADFNRVLRLPDDDAKYHPYCYYNRGIAYDQMGDIPKALNDYRLALTYDTDDAEFKPRVYNNVGLAHAKRRDFEEAIDAYTKAIHQSRNGYAEAYRNRGDAWKSLGEWEKAEADYKKAIERQDDYARALNNLGDLYADQGELNAAIGYYIQAIVADPHYMGPYHKIGQILDIEGYWELAIINYNIAIVIDPRNPNSHKLRGYAYMHRAESFDNPHGVLSFLFNWVRGNVENAAAEDFKTILSLLGNCDLDDSDCKALVGEANEQLRVLGRQ